MSAAPATALLERARPPDVQVPSGDPAEVARSAGVLAAAAESLLGSRWRLAADAQVAAEDSWRCGPGSAAYQGDVRRQTRRLDEAARALSLAAGVAAALASSLERGQAQARGLRAEAARLVREHDDLAEAFRRLALEPPVLLAGAATLGGLLAAAGERQSQERILEARVQWLAVECDRVAARAGALAEETARDARQAGAGLDAAASVTTIGRRQADRAELRRKEELGLLPAEDGSVLSRVSGLLGGLRDDVTEPLGAVAGLIGLAGDPRDRWGRLGSGLWASVQHPGELLDALLDLDDVHQGDWGHWVGTVGPSVVATVASAGGYGVVRGVQSLDVVDRAAGLAGWVRHEAELADLRERLLPYGGRAWSDLVPGGGLVAHERADVPLGLLLPPRDGGHTLSRHVGLGIDDLQLRLDRYGVPSASTFVDRASAERLVSEAFAASTVRIARWLAGETRTLTVVAPMHRPVGVTLLPPAPTLGRHVRTLVQSTSVKLVLVREPSRPLGFYLLTAYPTR